MSDFFQNDEKKETPAKKKMSGKDVTLKTMILAAAWIGILTLLKAFWHLVSETEFGLSMNEILLSGAVIAGVFSPVFVSIFLDKIKEFRIVEKVEKNEKSETGEKNDSAE